MGGCNPNTSPKFDICGSLRSFFRFFLWYFLFFFGLNFVRKFQPFKKSCHVSTMTSWEPRIAYNNTLNAYKALQMSHRSYYYQQEPLNINKNPLINQSKLAKMEKKKKKPDPNLKFAVAFGFFGLQPPPHSQTRSPWWQNFIKAKLGWMLFNKVPGATKRFPHINDKSGKILRDARSKFTVTTLRS